jgi:predicted transglutaminase-like cysteine proteinase
VFIRKRKLILASVLLSIIFWLVTFFNGSAFASDLKAVRKANSYDVGLVLTLTNEGIDAFNTRVNHTVKYISDKRNYGVLDYWASPNETLKRGGDCEDYAILKLQYIKHLLPEAHPQLLLLSKIEYKLHHAVVSFKRDGKTYILDNNSNEIKPVGSYLMDNSYIIVATME